MKKLLAYLLLWSSFIISSQDQQQGDPLLVVLLMVKNEATVMEKTLQPFLQAGVDSYLILDTGSTDNTIAVTQDLFQKYSVQRGYIEEQPFVDFATSRNYAIKKAEERFPKAQFFLMIDAEWYINNVEGLLEFCKRHVNDPVEAFLIAIHEKDGGHRVFYQNRLFRPRQELYFQGVVHETLSSKKEAYVPENIYFLYDPADVGQKKSEARWIRDRDLLLCEQEKNPDNSVTLYYLGQTYECLKDYQNALFWYKKRCEINDYDERKYIAYYHIACIYEHLQDFENAILYYIKAFEFRPTRAEPLVRLAFYYWGIGNYSECYKYAYTSTKIEKPKVGAMIEQETYDYLRYAILSAVALAFSQYEIGKWATLQALKAYPEDQSLLNNLARYNQYV